MAFLQKKIFYIVFTLFFSFSAFSIEKPVDSSMFFHIDGKNSNKTLAIIFNENNTDNVDSLNIDAFDTIKKSLIENTPEINIFMFIYEKKPKSIDEVEKVPGSSLFFENTISGIIKENKIENVLVLDMEYPFSGLAAVAESSGKLSPLRLLDITKEASLHSGIELIENPVAAYYTKFGLGNPFVILDDLLTENIPAIAVKSYVELPSLLGVTDLVAFVNSFIKSTASSTDFENDINYFRYKIFGKTITLKDRQIILIGLITIFVSAMYFCILYKSRNNDAGKDIIKELVYSLLLAFFSLLLASAFSYLADFVLNKIKPTFNLFEYDEALKVLITLIFRFLTTIASYFSISGFLSKLGLLRHQESRVNATMAASIIIWFDLIISVLFFQNIVPFLCVALVLLLLSYGTWFGISISFVFMMIIIIPMFDVNAISSSAGFSINVLETSFFGIFLFTFLLAPVGIWLTTAISNKTKIHRGDSIAFLWISGLVVFAIVESIFKYVG